MGFRCGGCQKDFGTNPKKLAKHLKKCEPGKVVHELTMDFLDETFDNIEEAAKKFPYREPTKRG